MDRFEGEVRVNWHHALLKLCRDMMNEEREERPSAEKVYSIVSHLQPPESGPSLGPCQCGRGGASTASQRLIDACKRSDGLTEVNSLLCGGQNIENKIGAIHQAARRGLCDIVEALLDHGADADLLDYSNQTALHCAAGYGHEAVIDLMLQRGANVNLKDEEDHIPLHYASGNGFKAWLVETLLPADVSDDGSGTVATQNIYGQTALNLAAKRGHHNVLVTLIGKMQNKSGIALGDKDQRTALHLAAGFGLGSVVEYLLDHAADSNLVNAQDANGWTARGKKNRNYSDVIQNLLKKGADVEARTYGLNKETAIDFAKGFEHEERLALLQHALDQSKGAPGASLAPPTSSADTEPMTNQLSQIILPHRRCSEEDLRNVSDKLRGFHPGWERLTKICIVLYIIDLPKRTLPEVLGKLFERSMTDHRLPIKANDLSDVLQPRYCARFDQQQSAVLSTELQLESSGEHCNLSTNDWESSIERITELGQGNSGKVFQVRNRDTGDVYALKLI